MFLQRRLTMAFSAALLWLLLSGRGNARVLTSLNVPESHQAPKALFSRKDGHKFVWRGDSRDSDTIRRAGGFRPRGNYVNDEEAYDLERHSDGAMSWKENQPDSRESSGESCTPSEMGWASAYVSTAASSRAVFRLPWVYLVRGTPNMIDSARALNIDYGEEEFAALGGILWSQVVGHMTVETLRGLDRDYPDGVPDDVAVENVVPNPHYNDERFRDSYAHSSLAEGYGTGSSQAAIAFMSRPEVGNVVGWTGRFPLLPGDSPCRSSSSSRESSSEYTRGDGPPFAGQQGQASAFTEDDMLAAAEYLREHNEPCEPDPDPLHSRLVIEAEDAIATSLERLGHNYGIAEADAFIQRAIDRMRRGEDGVCNLLGGCDSMFGKFYRQKRASEGPKRGLASFCGKIKKPKTDTCQHITNLRYRFTLSNDFLSGTFDTIALNFGTQESLRVANEPSSGFSVSKSVDLKRTFGSDEVAVRHLKWVSLVDLPSSGYFTKDAWQLQDLIFTAKCAASSKTMTMGKFQSVNKWLQHDSGFQPQTVWSGEIRPEDWSEV